jgi:regulator of replication initiation timing
LKLLISNTPVFIIFDSHPRPAYPNGAGFVFNTSLDATARHLERLLAVDSRLLADTTMQWQAQLLAQYSGHIFVSNNVKKNFSDMVQVVLHSSLATLALRAQISDLKYQNSSLTTENQRLYAENDILEDKCRKKDAEMMQAAVNSLTIGRKKAKSSSIRHPNPVAGPSRRGLDGLPLSKTSNHHPGTAHGQARGQSKDPRARSSEFSGTPYQIPLGISEIYRSQQRLLEEDARLQAEQQALASSERLTFKCGICLDEHPEDYIALIDVCSHKFCRDCIRGYIGSKISDHRFPILCPVCTTEKTGHEPGG